MSAEDDSEIVGPQAQGFPPSVQAGIPRLSPTPTGWTRVRLRDVLQDVQRPADLQSDTLYQLVTAKRSRAGIVAREKRLGKDIKVRQQFYVSKDDFILSNRQIAHGGCGIVPAHLNGAIVSNEYTVLVPNELIDVNYLKHYSNTVYFQQICFHSGVGVHVEKLVFRLGDWLNRPINLPPRWEQTKIVDALDAWDEAISATELQVSLKRSCRQATLDLFSEQGIDRKLSEIAEIRFSGVDKKLISGERSVMLCNYMDVFSNNKISRKLTFANGSATESEIQRFSLALGDVLFTKDSETPEDIARTAYVSEDLSNVICGYHLALLRPRASEARGDFLCFAMQATPVRNQFRRMSNGIVRSGLTMDAVEQITVRLPGLAAQAMIADALSAMDEEIVLLARRASLLRTQKKGLMQKLLTGEWRLPSHASVAA